MEVGSGEDKRDEGDEEVSNYQLPIPNYQLPIPNSQIIKSLVCVPF